MKQLHWLPAAEDLNLLHENGPQEKLAATV